MFPPDSDGWGNRKYIGSYQNKLETLVFHVFEQEVVE